MRKLLGLVILCAILSICAQSYGYFLVYDISSTIHGSDKDINAKITIPLKGYLVLKLSDGNNAVIDANLILYGKDIYGYKVYYLLDPVDGNNQFKAETRYIGREVYIAVLGGNPYHFEMMLSGTTSSRDIGFGADYTRNVAGSLKGVNTIWTGFVLGPYDGQDVSGTANASAVLVNGLTIYANKHNWTQEQIVYGDSVRDGLLDILYAKRYGEGPYDPDSYIGGITIVDTSSSSDISVSEGCISTGPDFGGSDAYGIYAEGEISTQDINGVIQEVNTVSP